MEPKSAKETTLGAPTMFSWALGYIIGKAKEQLTNELIPEKLNKWPMLEQLSGTSEEF